MQNIIEEGVGVSTAGPVGIVAQQGNLQTPAEVEQLPAELGIGGIHGCSGDGMQKRRMGWGVQDYDLHSRLDQAVQVRLKLPPAHAVNLSVVEPYPVHISDGRAKSLWRGVDASLLGNPHEAVLRHGGGAGLTRANDEAAVQLPLR